jgi:hypothetical protein
MAHLLLRLLEQPDHLSVGRLGKVGVVHADGVERVGGQETHDLVTFSRDFIETIPRSDRHGENEVLRPALSHASQRRLHRPAGGDAIVDHDNGAPAGIGGGPLAAIEKSTAFDFGELPLLFRGDVTRRRSDHIDDLPIEHELRVPAVDHSTDAKLLMPGRADLAHQQEVERRGE